MKHIVIKNHHGCFEEWRTQARACLQDNIPPEQILWGSSRAVMQDLFAGLPAMPPRHARTVTVDKKFIDLAQTAICHAHDDRFALLYRILWRLNHGDRNLLHYKTDSDVMTLYARVKAVRRDAYKIKAFLRFRGVEREGAEHFIAWYEPEHYSLELALPFFQTRFKNMTWSILTPYMTAHWDRETLIVQDNHDPTNLPGADEVEQYWLKYYATTFNPARPKKSAMLNQMPKKYWKNMPETVLIPELLRNADRRARTMIDKSSETSG